MAYRDLREFIDQLEQLGELKRVTESISPHLEMTALCDLSVRSGGPALLFENPTGHAIPVLANLFGSTRRIALGMGASNIQEIRQFGQVLANLQQPPAPHGVKEFVGLGHLIKTLWNMAPHTLSNPPCQAAVIESKDVDLAAFPIQHCWPEDAAPLITWGLVITQGPNKPRQNLGIYRQQVLARNKVILRWLPNRGGALDFRDHALAHPGVAYPVCVALGADPATMLGAVTPVPDNMSEYQFAGLLRGSRTDVAKAIGSNLRVPASAEIVLEGHIYADPDHASGFEHAMEGPFGDHTGYYNEQACFPVLTIDRITHRIAPIYLSTYTGKPPDEPAMLGLALNELFVPLLQRQYPEITDFYLPPEGCSYRLAVVQINKSYPGHARQIMFGIWSFLRQFTYTKFIVVVDMDVDIRSWAEVVWAITTRMDPLRDTLLAGNTPIDYLDFASPVSGIGSKMGLDATNKWPGETCREWGRPIKMDLAVSERMKTVWETLRP